MSIKSDQCFQTVATIENVLANIPVQIFKTLFSICTSENAHGKFLAQNGYIYFLSIENTVERR